MTADEVKDALRRRHPATQTRNGYVTLDAWTVLEEWLAIDLLAISAYENPRKGARTEKVPNRYRDERRTIARYPIVGYEVKVSRSDYRRELLNPTKREPGRRRCHEFYFAVPKGLLKPDELAYREPAWTWPDDFQPKPCRHSFYGDDRPLHGADLSVCYRGRRTRTVHRGGERWPEYAEERCEGCRGRGYAETSRVQRDAPTLWVPADVGLVEVDGRGARITRPSPVIPQPEMIAADVPALVRFVSLHPDPRHVAVLEANRRLAEMTRRRAA